MAISEDGIGRAPDDLAALIRDVQKFIDLSFRDEEKQLREWIDETVNRLEIRCWAQSDCQERACPAFENECGRCWLIAGTMCGGMVNGKLAQKYSSCAKCGVFRGVIVDDPVRELRELIIVLIKSIRSKHRELLEAQSEIKILSGLLPTCMYCKQIRDEAGGWHQLESYITEKSEAKFSHGICPGCLEKHYPGMGKKKTD